ncbi:MAG: hypothetical protein WAM60_01565 [Candidatus Promineifilaceae bacterium]
MKLLARKSISRLCRICLLLILIISPFLFRVQPVSAAPGIDGNQTITAVGEVVNLYAPVTAIVGNVVTVTDINLLDDTANDYYTNDDLSAGDMILIYQAQGAAFTDSSDTMNYGAFDYNSAGTYEFASVASVSGNDITVDDSNSLPYSCGGVSGTYDTVNGNVQVIRVPQYANLIVNVGASIVGGDWNGTIGGVVAVLVQSILTVNGSIDVSGQGFRGGVVENNSPFPGRGTTNYRTTNINDGAEKGESILGYQAVYDVNNGRYGRGAPANGGGGGNSHNSGGGGGANGDNGGTAFGQGLPDTSNSAWDPAWDIDDGTAGVGDPLPFYFIGGAGGGRGGYSYSASDQDALTVEPGNAAWAGDNHRNVGGFGGRPLNDDPSLRLFFGGGGGAGDSNNNQGNSGGNGGGLVVITAFTLLGTGQILANGADVPNVLPPNYSDGNGGGGAGGTVVIGASSVAGVTISADGGNGGSIDDGTGIGCFDFGTEVCTVGPGGGGGGGYVHVNTAFGTLTTSVTGGANGIDTSDFVGEFPHDGATSGYDGASNTTSFSFPGCASPTAIGLSGTAANNSNSAEAVIPVIFIVLIITTALIIWRRESPAS